MGLENKGREGETKRESEREKREKDKMRKRKKIYGEERIKR